MFLYDFFAWLAEISNKTNGYVVPRIIVVAQVTMEIRLILQDGTLAELRPTSFGAQ